MVEETHDAKVERQGREKNIKVTIIETGLKAPFAPNKIKWRAADFRGNKSSALLYLDARDVMDRLDEVVGINNWQTEYKDIENRCVCKLSVRYDNDFDWVLKSDLGTQSTFEGDKGMYSDALKRAAVQHGIGRYLYDDSILGKKRFPLDNKKFTKEADEMIMTEVATHYRLFTNQKAVMLNTLFKSAMTYKTIMEYYEENKSIVSELKEEDAVAAKAVGDSFKNWAKALKGMENNG
jgi:hypothetical protein